MIAELSHEAKEVLYVYGTIDELHQKGLIESVDGIGMPMTNEGRAAFIALKSSGFTVDDNKGHEIMKALGIQIQQSDTPKDNNRCRV